MRKKKDYTAIENIAKFISLNSKEMAGWIVNGDNVEIKGSADGLAKIFRVKKTIISPKD